MRFVFLLILVLFVSCGKPGSIAPASPKTAAAKQISHSQASADSKISDVDDYIPLPPAPADQSSPRDPSIYDPSAFISFIELKSYPMVDDVGANIYRDVLTHTDPNDKYNPRGRGLQYELRTVIVHETTHLLNGQISWMKMNSRGIFLRNGKAVSLMERGPKITQFNKTTVPASMRSHSDYKLYLVNQPTSQPTLDELVYLFDEWTCYLQNGPLTLELESTKYAEKVSTTGRGSDNAMAFFGFSSAGIAYAFKTNHKSIQDKQFMATFAFLAEETFRYAKKSLESKELGKNNFDYLKYFRESAEYQEIRQALKEIYGAAWWDHLVY